MNNLTYKFELRKTLEILIADFMAVGFVMVVPAISHLLAFPLFYLDPLRLALLTVYFVRRNHKNAYILALSLPIFSMILSGHPVFLKAVLISGELFINVILVHLFFRKGLNVFFAVFFGIAISKVIYYFFKFLFLKWSLIAGELITTNLVIQLAVALGLSIVFGLFWDTKREKPATK